jgi:hypothetical protein
MWRLGDWMVSRFVDKSMGQLRKAEGRDRWNRAFREGEIEGLNGLPSHTATVPSSVSWQLDPLCGMLGACCSSRARKLHGVSYAREEWLARPCGHLSIRGPWEDGR